MRSLALALLCGCTVVVHVDSQPIPADVETPQGEQFRLPADVPVRWVPFRRPDLICTGVGYRPITLPLRLGLGPLAFHPPRPVDVVLVPEHGPTGTWSEEEVP